jgi:hypothetical protein
MEYDCLNRHQGESDQYAVRHGFGCEECSCHAVWAAAAVLASYSENAEMSLGAADRSVCATVEAGARSARRKKCAKFVNSLLRVFSSRKSAGRIRNNDAISGAVAVLDVEAE